MSRHRYALTDFVWSVIAPRLPKRPRGVARLEAGETVREATRALSVTPSSVAK